MKKIIDRAEASYLMSQLGRGNPALPIRAPDFDHLVGRFAAACFVIALRRVDAARLMELAEEAPGDAPEYESLRGIAGSGDFNAEDRGGYLRLMVRSLADADIDAVFGDRSARGVNWLYAMRIDIVKLSEFIAQIESNLRAVRSALKMPHSRAELKETARAALADCAWEEHTSAPRAARLMARSLRLINNDEPATVELVLPRFVCDAAAEDIADDRLVAPHLFSAIECGAYAELDVAARTLTIVGPGDDGEFETLRVVDIGALTMEGAPLGVAGHRMREVVDEGGVCARIYLSAYCTEEEYRAALPEVDSAIQRGKKGWHPLSDVVVACLL